MVRRGIPAEQQTRTGSRCDKGRFAMRTLAQKAPETAPARSAPLHRPHLEQMREMSPIQQLQRRMGNQGLQTLVQAHTQRNREPLSEMARTLAASETPAPSTRRAAIGAAEFGRRTG